ncbi:MAG: hypothetical protein HY721_04415 [Planctomycetes bacterium]|nr:hypothetical protein [Planctomycetota bacterium]
MLRTLILSAVGLAFLAALGAGCQTKEPVIYGAAHNKRRALTVIDGFKRSALDVERVFFGLEEHPNEGFVDNMGRLVMTVPYGLHRFHMNFDRIIFDMEEYPLESEY